MRSLVVLAAACLACATVRETRGVPGGEELRATLASPSGDIALHRWTPSADAIAKTGGPRVVVIPELGFDHRLVSPLCARLARLGFDVVTFDPPRGLKSFDAFVLTAARVVATRHEPVRLLAIGVGGEAAFEIARAGGVSGIVAVNVPLRYEVGDVAFARALADDLFSPRGWTADDARARLLLGGGRSTPWRELARLERATVALSPALAADVADRFARHASIVLPHVPIRLFASVKDNVVPPEDVLEPPDPSWHPAYARRLGKMELFARDYGHLDWLASDRALDDVVPALADALEALP